MDGSLQPIRDDDGKQTTVGEVGFVHQNVKAVLRIRAKMVVIQRHQGSLEPNEMSVRSETGGLKKTFSPRSDLSDDTEDADFELGGRSGGTSKAAKEAKERKVIWPSSVITSIPSPPLLETVGCKLFALTLSLFWDIHRVIIFFAGDLEGKTSDQQEDVRGVEGRYD